MATQLSQRDLRRAASRFEQIKNRIANIKKKAEKTTEKVIRTGETAGAAFVMGVIQGRYNGVEVMGVPLDLGAGVALNIAGYFGAAGRHSDHLNNLGDGCLAAFATTSGRGIGMTWRQKAGLPAGSSAQLDTARTSGVTLTPQEVAAAAAMAMGR